MTAGVPLTDADRADWLWALHREIRERAHQAQEWCCPAPR
jgi:gluconate kinase